MPAPPPGKRDHDPNQRLFGMLLVTVLFAWFGWAAFDTLLPPQDNPFKPLDLAREPGLATGLKLDRLEQNPAACYAALDEAGVAYTRIDLDNDQSQCVVANALTLDRSLTPYSATLSMSCPLAAALYMWERHVVIPAARDILGADVTRIETFGSYSCRRVNSASSGRWSQHAAANAVDISGVQLSDGRRVMILGAFDDDTPEGEFLRTIRDGACRLFSATLSPDYNALHADHLHLDMGVFTTCS